jgi:hypothetical protein
MTKFFTIISIISLSACSVLPGGSAENDALTPQCFASLNRCDPRDTRKLDGTPYLHCEGNPNDIMLDLESAGYTVEYDFTWNGLMNGMGNHAVAPSTADFMVAPDSVNCTVDGDGPYHCSHENSVFIVPSFEIQLDPELFAEMRSHDLGLCIEVIRE